PRAEEGDLEAVGLIEPAGDVPPFDAEFRMRAVIARKLEFVARCDSRIRDLAAECGGGKAQSGQGEKERSSSKPRKSGSDPEFHQSSRTARTGPMPMASLPERMAVRIA